MGKGTKVDCGSHRAVSRTFATIGIIGFYGDAQSPDVEFAKKTMLQASSASCPVQIILGDWNWRRVYEDLLTDEWKQTGSVCSKKDSAGTPFRAICRGSSVKVIEADPILGIPGDMAMTVEIEEVLDKPKIRDTRGRNTALYAWTTAPTKEEIAEHLEVARSRAPNPADCVLGGWMEIVSLQS